MRDAVVRLGPSTLLSLTMSSRLGGRMIAALPAYGLQAGELWGHSVAASIAADVIRSRSPRPIPAEAATAALLHDFGKVVLAKHLGNQILDTLALAAATDGLDIVEAERVVFGLTHAEIGGSWPRCGDCPLTIVDGIRDHHDAHEEPVDRERGRRPRLHHVVRDHRPGLDGGRARAAVRSPPGGLAGAEGPAARLRDVLRHRRGGAQALRRGVAERYGA